MKYLVLLIAFLLFTFSHVLTTAAQETKNKSRYRMSQLDFMVEEKTNTRLTSPQSAEANARAKLQSLPGAEHLDDQGVIIRTQSVRTEDIIKQLKETSLSGINIKVRNTDRLLDQVTAGGSYYLKQTGPDNTLTIHDQRP